MFESAQAPSLPGGANVPGLDSAAWRNPPRVVLDAGFVDTQQQDFVIRRYQNGSDGVAFDKG
jgi:hypothetical protein